MRREHRAKAMRRAKVTARRAAAGATAPAEGREPGTTQRRSVATAVDIAPPEIDFDDGEQAAPKLEPKHDQFNWFKAWYPVHVVEIMDPGRPHKTQLLGMNIVIWLSNRMADPDLDQNVQVFKIKRLIRNLEKARGNGTSMISLIIPPKEQVAKQQKMLADEYGTASNIKSRVNRLSVLSAITATQQRLKLYNKVPPNGLVVYCGTIMTDEGKEKKVTIDFEPFKPINTSLYLCDNKFHTEALSDLLTDDNRFGFIIMDGNGCLFATLTGNTRDIIQKFDVDLPKKHGRGGQSALRFARLRMEKRHNFVRKVAETAVKCFIKDDKVSCVGLILAGSADFKTELNGSDMFDQRLAAKVIRTVDVSYGGENGFNQAIELVQDDLSNVKFVQEKKLICQYFDEISRDTGKYCFAIGDTVSALEQGAVETLIIWENLDIKRYVFRNPVSELNEVKYLNQTEEKDRKHFVDKSTGQELESISVEPFIDWLVDTDESNAPNYKQYGTQLEIVTDRSQEGAQFVKGFGGIGGLLRYPVDFAAQEYISDEDDFDLDDY